MKPGSTVFIVDDDPSIRQWLIELMEEIQQPALAFGSAGEFLEAYDPAQPGCLVLDIRMPGMSGTHLQRTLLADGVNIPIIFITGRGDVQMAVEAMQRGAVDFLEKPVRSQTLIDGVQRALVQDSELRRLKAEREAIAARYELLTQRERQVVELAMSGITNKSIAAKLGVSSQTVDSHRAKALATMKAESVVELVRMLCALDCGRIEPPPRQL